MGIRLDQQVLDALRHRVHLHNVSASCLANVDVIAGVFGGPLGIDVASPSPPRTALGTYSPDCIISPQSVLVLSWRTSSSFAPNALAHVTWSRAALRARRSTDTAA